MVKLVYNVHDFYRSFSVVHYHYSSLLNIFMLRNRLSGYYVYGAYIAKRRCQMLESKSFLYSLKQEGKKLVD